ncbi:MULTISPECIES: Rieske (2Fe-2S) protein [unclassified Bacillus (in: firmicutes)]|uniref:Rieske (2Fe-2S) protein n=1 Tax=unclassified Bacillus (in: firmicutes) TaxID=185979 RepID=UPI0008F28B85|nr:MULTISPECIES: Rieske (2Fe-2S) protein [unclassified Bacillus (in: firmicutes)]SFB07998.1 Ferredoxin subunit of nitrite reductase or a ring-hydroxylating dioxygenase [Bacillus sp. UNCCL13]SFQ87166.1 Ferredoxin subunit of nitrite reductase or a ring-hydroxylating dioxygenase [Bacillus sp. cl95]
MSDKNKKIPFHEDNYTHNIDRNNERKLDRRGFMKTLVGAAGVFAVSSLPWGAMAAKELAGLGEKEYPHKKIADVNAVGIGDAVDFAFPGEHDSAILIRISDEKYVAYQNACTHLRCPVFWVKEDGEMVCPCHHGKFDVATGEPTAGPPRRPLPEIQVKVENGSIYAVRVKRYEA